jgi:hypothetical protein
MKRTVFCFIILFVLSSFCVAAVPQIGHQFYGYAVDTDATISAEVNGVTFSTTSDDDGYYGYDPVFFVGAASDEESGGDDDDTVTWSINGMELGTTVFTIAGVTELNFDDAFGYEGDGSLGTSGVDDGSNDQDTDGSSDSDSDDDSSNDDSDRDDGWNDWTGAIAEDDLTSTSSAQYQIPCGHEWECEEWNACEDNGFQTRICYYTGGCANEESDKDRPDTRQVCVYVPPVEIDQETCWDEMQNQGERGVDCGGPCSACEEQKPVVVEEPSFNWMYLVLGILLLVVIGGVILAHYYKDGRLQVWLEKINGKKAVAAVGKVATVKKAAVGPRQATQYRRPQYMPKIPAKPAYRVPLKKQ